MFLSLSPCVSMYIQVPPAKKEEVKEEKKELEEPKFQAFTGKKYSLRDWVGVFLQTLLLQYSCSVKMWNNRRSEHCLNHFEAKTTSTKLVWASSSDIYMVLDVIFWWSSFLQLLVLCNTLVQHKCGSRPLFIDVGNISLIWQYVCSRMCQKLTIQLYLRSWVVYVALVLKAHPTCVLSSALVGTSWMR